MDTMGDNLKIAFVLFAFLREGVAQNTERSGCPKIKA